MTRAQIAGPTRYDGTNIEVPDGVAAVVLLRQDGPDILAEYCELRSGHIDRDAVVDALLGIAEAIA